MRTFVFGLMGLWGCTRPAPSEVVVEAATFMRGSPPDEACRASDETQTKAKIRRFAISRHEVTQAEFRARMRYNPSFNKGCDRCPVERVTQHEAAAYCNALSKVQRRAPCYTCEGKGAAIVCSEKPNCAGYRLPTEAEWEYAARANTAPIDIDDCMGSVAALDDLGWYKANSFGRTHAVGKRAPNAWGLYDMAGNVAEWTSEPRDRHPRQRVMKGGSWYHNAEHARPAARRAFRAQKRLSYVGFRCVRSL